MQKRRKQRPGHDQSARGYHASRKYHANSEHHASRGYHASERDDRHRHPVIYDGFIIIKIFCNCSPNFISYRGCYRYRDGGFIRPFELYILFLNKELHFHSSMYLSVFRATMKRAVSALQTKKIEKFLRFRKFHSVVCC